MCAMRVVGVLIGVVVGATLGGVLGRTSGGSQMVVVVWASIGAVVGGVISLIVSLLPEDTWGRLGSLVEEYGCLVEALLDCCFSFAVLVVASVVTIAGFLLWHNLLLAALAGGSIMTMTFIILSVVAASYKAGRQSSSSRKVSHDEQGTAVFESSLHGTGSQA